VGFSGQPALREAGLDLRADNDSTLETGMVLSLGALRPAAAGGVRCSDIAVITEAGADVLTDLPRGPEGPAA
jgi:Xaa-Pro aminopeptidase